MRTLLLFIFIISSTCIYSQQEEREIRAVLADQEECWNEGDIDCFMDGYWRSEQLTFVGKSGVTYGWQNTLDNYKKRYPDREAMGTLTFEIKLIEPLSEEFWHVIGKYNLDRQTDNPNGHFSLLFRKIDDQWVIVADHTS